MSAFQLRVNRARDSTSGTEHRASDVIPLTLAFPSRSLTPATSLPHLIAQVYVETIAPMIQLSVCAFMPLDGSVTVLRDGTELAQAGVARCNARKLPALLDHCQIYKVR